MKSSSEYAILLKGNRQKAINTNKDTFDNQLDELKYYIKNEYLCNSKSNHRVSETLHKASYYQDKDDKNNQTQELDWSDFCNQDQNDGEYNKNLEKAPDRLAILPTVEKNSDKSKFSWSDFEFDFQYQDTRRVLPLIDRLSLIPQECKEFNDINQLITHGSITQVVFTPRKKKKIFEQQKIEPLEKPDFDFGIIHNPFLNNQELERSEVNNNDNHELGFIGNN
jgi:hypothetical protein